MPLQDHTVSPAIQQVYRRLSCRGEVGLAVIGETNETCTPPIVLTQGTIEVYETSHHLRGTQNELLLHSFTGLFSISTWVCRYQKGKTSLDLYETKEGWTMTSAGPYVLHLAPDR